MNSDQLQEWVDRSRRDHAKGLLSPEVFNGVEEVCAELKRQWSMLASLRAKVRYGSDVASQRPPTSQCFISVVNGERAAETECFALPFEPNALDRVRLEGAGLALEVTVLEVSFYVLPESITRVCRLSRPTDDASEFAAVFQKATAIASFLRAREARQ